MEAFKYHVSSIRTPFLVIHDPTDEVKPIPYPPLFFLLITGSHTMTVKVCSIAGSVALVARSSTHEADKKMIEVPGYLHGLIANHPTEVLTFVHDWTASRLH